jgi:molybdate transport system substrate-binding protein
MILCRLLFLFALFVMPVALSAADETLIVAAAANLTDVFKEVSTAFTKDTGIKVNLSFGSTQQLTQQIENGAPFDVFAAADTEHIDQLAKEGLLAAGSNVPYARGFLVLWCPAEQVKSLDDLRTAPIKFLAVAKPEAAPYGRAAVEALQKTGLWPVVEKRVVYAENITLAKQYVSSGNAECGFVAKSLVRDQAKGVIAVDPALYQPIRQSLGTIKASPHKQAAQRFSEFVLGAKGQQILAAWGYASAR